MQTPYKDLELSFSQYIILRRIKLFGKIKRSKVDTSAKYKFLKKYSLVQFCDGQHKFYSLSDKALFLMRYRKKDRIRFYFPIVISILALLKAYGLGIEKLLAQIIQALTQ